MGSLRYAAGDPTYYNLLSRCSANVSVGGDGADALFPAANLWDGRPSKPFREGAGSATLTITVDGTLIVNGNLNTWSAGLPTGSWLVFTTGAGSTVTETAVAGEVVTGSAAKLHCGTTGGAAAAVYVDQPARSGEELTLAYSIRGSGATGVVKVIVQNQATGNYLNSSLAWVSGVTVLDSRTANTHLAGTKTFTVESYATSLVDTMNIRAIFYNDDIAGGAGSNGFVDDVALYPSVDFASIHGGVILPARVGTLRSSTDNFAASDTVEATFAYIQPAFYKLLAAKVARRYWRLSFLNWVAVWTGNSADTVEIGEAIIGQTSTLGRNPDFPIEWGEIADDVVAETPAGEMDVAPLTKVPRRTVGLHIQFNSNTTMEEGRDLWRRARGRTYPIVIIPDTDRPDVVLGRLERDWKTLRSFNTYYSDTDITVAELPFASPTL